MEEEAPKERSCRLTLRFAGQGQLPEISLYPGTEAPPLRWTETAVEIFMRAQLSCLAAVLSLTSSLAWAQAASPPPMGPMAMADMAKSPGAYVTAAGESDKFEITEGRLAQSMASSPKIKAFGEKMIADHTKSTMEVLKAAKASGLPKMPPPVLRPDQQEMIAKLKMTSGPAFDQLYVQQQMQSHQQALMVQQNYAEHGTAPALKMAAKKIVPVVKEHISMLRNMSSGM